MRTFSAASVLILTNTASAFSLRQNILRNSNSYGLKISTLVKNYMQTKDTMFFANEVSKMPGRAKDERRVLGSQENLMLPRQYAPGDVKFPQMNHVSCTILSATPPENLLREAIDQAIMSHPLLRCHVEGNGEPDERIDFFQMVRKGEPNPCTFVSPESSFTSKDVLTIVQVEGSNRSSIDSSWEAAFKRDLDNGSWCNVEKGPLWKMELHRPKSGYGTCAIIFSFNHAISDQSSANMLTDQIIANIAALEGGEEMKPTAKLEMPMALEDSVLGSKKRFSDIQVGGFTPETLQYVAGKAGEGLKNPVILPDSTAPKDGGGLLGALTIITGKAAGGVDETSQERKSTLQFRKLSEKATSALLAKCRQNGVSMTNALTAAMTLTATDFIDNGVKSGSSRNYKVLQSLDMKRFGDQLDNGETIACMAGSMDLMHGPLDDRSGETLRQNPSTEQINMFWGLAREGKEQTSEFVKSDGPRNAARVFDFAMTISDMNNLVDLTSKSSDSLGRAYSAGVTNVGVYDRQKAVRREGDIERDTLKAKHGKYEIEDIYFATSHARTGCLYQASCLTVAGEMMCTFHPASPIVSDETNFKFADAFMDTLEIVAGTKQVAISDGLSNPLAAIPKNALTVAATFIGAGAVAIHAGGFINFFSSVLEMKANVENPEDFWAAVNFWIFFAVGHPILQPILWISDVLHGSPGPKIADLIPYTFVAANVVAIAAVTTSKEIRNAVNIAAFAAFLAYVGAGLDGQAGLGDYNLALDDPYQGKVVKGCPAYEEVRQSSMNNFDLQKYQGKWYEHKFHDWTQFKEVYDTTLDIKVTADGNAWTDDFGVKGPAPDAAPLSWDKSPVANGAHYFLFGRVDKNDPPGILRESGFGVEFPNYIVDVQKDPATGMFD